MKTILLLASFLGAAGACAQTVCVDCTMAPRYARSAVSYAAPASYGSSGATAVRSYGSAGATAVVASNGSAGGYTAYQRTTAYRRGLFGRLRPVAVLQPVTTSVATVAPVAAVVAYRSAPVQEYVPMSVSDVPASAPSEADRLEAQLRRAEQARDDLSTLIESGYDRLGELRRQASPAAPTESSHAMVMASLRDAPRAPHDLPAASLARCPKAPSEYLVAIL